MLASKSPLNFEQHEEQRRGRGYQIPDTFKSTPDLQISKAQTQALSVAVTLPVVAAQKMLNSIQLLAFGSEPTCSWVFEHSHSSIQTLVGCLTEFEETQIMTTDNATQSYISTCILNDDKAAETCGHQSDQILELIIERLNARANQHSDSVKTAGNLLLSSSATDAMCPSCCILRDTRGSKQNKQQDDETVVQSNSVQYT